jgi:hypothetical protein
MASGTWAKVAGAGAGIAPEVIACDADMRVCPPRCRNCGRAISNLVQSFHTFMDTSMGLGPGPAQRLRVLNDCCVAELLTAPVDKRLVKPVPSSQTFAYIHGASRLAAAPQTLRADGTTDPI